MLSQRLLAGRDGCAEDSRHRSSATKRLLRRSSRVALASTGTAAGAARSPAQTQPNACACVRVRVRACVCVVVGRSVCPSHHTVGGEGGWPPRRRAREWTAHTARRPPRVSGRKAAQPTTTAVRTRGSRQRSRRRTQRPRACRPHPPTSSTGLWLRSERSESAARLPADGRTSRRINHSL